MDFSRLTAVIADDHKTSREIVITALRTCGMRNFHEAEDGGEAFGLVSRYNPDFLIVDLEMPHDGIRVLNAVRRSVESPNIQMPVIAMTGHTERHRIFELRDAGASEILSKPLTLERICSRVSAALLRPRRFIICDGYVGPCRRRGVMQNYHGPLRRRSDDAADELMIG